MLLSVAHGLAQEQGQASKTPLFSVKAGGNWGFIDASGALKIPARYSEVGAFEVFDGEFVAAKLDKWGLIDRTGNWILEPRFYVAEECGNRIAAVETDDAKWRFINLSGEFVDSSRYDQIMCFREGPLAVVTEGDHAWTYLDRASFRPIPVHQVIPEGFREGLTPMQAGSLWGFVNELGAFVIPPRFDEARGFSESLAAVRIGDKWGYANKHGEIVIPPKFGWAYGFSEGLGGVELDGKYGFIGTDGKFVIPPIFRDVRAFSEGLAAVEKNSEWGYVDKQGNLVIEARFENNALPFSSGIAQVRLGDAKIGYINKSGEFIWNPSD